MAFKDFKQMGDGHISLDMDRIIGLGDSEPGRTRIWMQGCDKPFEVVGDPDEIKRSIERDRREAAQPIYQKPLG